MPGISDIAAQVIVAEIGIDMTRFETPAHLVSWAGLCPRNDESAGKRRCLGRGAVTRAIVSQVPPRANQTLAALAPQGEVWP